jgi:hypothetical protein
VLGINEGLDEGTDEGIDEGPGVGINEGELVGIDEDEGIDEGELVFPGVGVGVGGAVGGADRGDIVGFFGLQCHPSPVHASLAHTSPEFHPWSTQFQSGPFPPHELSEALIGC